MSEAEPPERPLPPRRDAAIAALLPDVARGVRAAVVTLPPFFLARQLGMHELAWVALGGWLGTLDDPGGTPRARGRTLATFTLLGALLVVAGETIGPHPWAGVLALAVTAFVTALFRVFGAAATATGTLLCVVMAIAIGGSLGHPIRDALAFTLGSAAATLLSSIVWPVWTHLPVRVAIAPAWRALARYAEAMGAYLEAGGSADDVAWTELLRKHQPALRAALETAREAALASRARHNGESVLGSNLRTLISAAETQTGLLIALGELHGTSQMERRKVDVFAVLARRYEELARIIQTPKLDDRPFVEPPAPEVEHEISKRLLQSSAAALRVAHAPSTPAISPDGIALVSDVAAESDLRILRDALSLRSPWTQHALRVALAVVVAGVVGNRFSPAHAHWVTITTIAVLQPYPGATLTRAIERVLGTVVGSLVAVAIMFTVRNPLALAAIMFPLLIVAMTTKPRSYRMFTLFLTPVFVLLAERWTADWGIAVDRCRDGLIGGAVALGAALLFPSREDARLSDAVRVMLDALQAYADEVLGRILRGEPTSDRTATARREFGIAIGLAETSLERLLAEPLRSAPTTGDALLLVTQARRLSSALTMLDVTHTTALGAGEKEAAQATRAWVDGVLAAARAGARPTTRAPDLSGFGARPVLENALVRIERTAELLAPPMTPSRFPPAAR